MKNCQSSHNNTLAHSKQLPVVFTFLLLLLRDNSALKPSILHIATNVDAKLARTYSAGFSEVVVNIIIFVYLSENHGQSKEHFEEHRVVVDNGGDAWGHASSPTQILFHVMAKYANL